MIWGAGPGAALLAVVAVHGRDQDPAFMRGVADRVDLPGVRWLAPVADAGTWYPGSFLQPVEDNEPRLGWAVDAVGAARAQLLREGFGAERVVLVGFSQGAVVLTEHLLRGAEPCAGAALLTGGWAGTVPAARAALAGMPVLLGSSAYDVLVPVERVRDTARVLVEAGADVTLEVYDDREHLVSDRAVASTRALLAGVLSRTAARGR